jgi:hypothetical protein
MSGMRALGRNLPGHGAAVVWVAVLALASLQPSLVTAAQQAPVDWADPVNLSRSGAATNPVVIYSDASAVHVAWEDAFAGGMYAFFDGEQWSEPTAGTTPFATTNVQFVDDGQGWVHGLWMDLQGSLNHSKAPVNRLGSPQAWSSPVVVADSAPTFAVAVDAAGELHVAYLRSPATMATPAANVPAGVFYRRSTDEATDWLPEVSLFESAYLRGVTLGQASVDLALSAAGTNSAVYVTWDNRPRKEILLAKSADSGRSWAEPMVVARLDPSIANSTPHDLRVETRAESVVLAWQAGEPVTGCRQRFQTSPDGGATWNVAQPMFERNASCALDKRFFRAPDGLLYLMAEFPEGMYLSAWDGERWSEPQFQFDLQSFVDVETGAQVLLGCRQAGLSPDNRLIVLGCDLAGGGDVWMTSRPMDDAAAWFGPAAAWSQPALTAVTPGASPAPVLLSDGQSRWHALWVQADPAGGASSQQSIFHALWDGNQWSTPQVALSLPGEDIAQFAAGMSDDERLQVVWSGKDSGRTYFSWAGVAPSVGSLAWIPPQPLRIPAAAGVSAAALLDANAALKVAYSVPINEGRGIYLTQSVDRGTTWLTATAAFSGTAAGWAVLGAPQLAQSADGSLHLLFERLSPPLGGRSLGLYYARFDAGGTAWSGAEPVAETGVTWSRLLSDRGSTIHRLWQSTAGAERLLWHAVSTDGGRSWGPATPIPGVSTSVSVAAATVDPSGRLHLVAVDESLQAGWLLHHHRWDPDGWRAEEGAWLAEAGDTTVEALSVAASASGQLSVLYRLQSLDLTTRQPVWQMALTQRSIDLAAVAAMPTATAEVGAVPVLTTTPPADATVEPTATLDVGSLGAGLPPATVPGSSTSMIGLGAGLALLCVALGFGVVLLARRNRAQGAAQRLVRGAKTKW